MVGVTLAGVALLHHLARSTDRSALDRGHSDPRAAGGGADERPARSGGRGGPWRPAGADHNTDGAAEGLKAVRG